MAKTERTFSIVIPKFDNEGHRITTDESKRVAIHMSNHFGGVSVFPNILGCFADNDKLQCEPNILLVSARQSTNENDFEKDRDFLAKLAHREGIKLGQKSIFTEEDIIQNASWVAGERKQSVPKKLRETDVFKKVIGD
jgi:hypothetical protein